MLKRKLPGGPAPVAQPPKKKARTNPGEVAFLSSNVCGFDTQKWGNLKQMADDHDIDIIAIQEGASKKAVDSIVGSDWESIVTQEAPYAKKIGDVSVPNSVGKCSFNVMLKRATATDITLKARAYYPDQSPAVKQYCFPDAKAPEPGKRVRKAKVDLDLTNKLGVRGPQWVELTIPGHHAVSVYNHHAPQGNGSEQGYSGMDASKGHEILKLLIQDDSTPQKMVIGDQNAHPDSMRLDYPNLEILSATTSSTELCHAAIPRGLNPTPVDLGTAGSAFNNKGKPGCSDHPPMAFFVTIPKST
jgi:hypothetical protein